MAASASPSIWEEARDNDDDVPLSSLGPGTVRRSKTTASRLQRFTGGSSGRLSPTASLNAPGTSRSGEVTRTNSLKLAPSIRSIKEYDETPQSQESGQSSYEEQLSNVHDVDDDDELDDSVLFNPGSQTSLARHSSMPLSRAVGRGNNASAPWNRAAAVPDIPASPMSAAKYEHEGRMRSSSTAAEAARLPPIPLSPIDNYYAQARSTSGFSVISRPAQATTMRTVAGHPGSVSLHSRSASSNGWAGSATNNASSTSPSHSRHASESLVGTPTLQQFSHSGSSTPPPASPIDASILGANNPWSPTAEEKQHFRQFGAQPHHHHANLPSEGAETRTAAGVRRANSLTATIGSGRARAAVESVRQPARKNTPLLPPLVTSAEVLHNPAVQEERAASQTAHPLPSRPLQPFGAPSTQPASAHIHNQSLPGQPHMSRFGGGSRPPQANALYQSFGNPVPGPSADRQLATAGPGLPSSLYYREKERIVGLGNSNGVTDSPQRAPMSSNAMSPVSAFSTSTIQFPSLNDPSSTAAFQSNLALQQQLLAQQTAQLQDQQAQLAAALQAGLSIRDLPPTAPQTSLAGVSSDPYAIAARIDALQRANAILAASRIGQAPMQAQPPAALGSFNPFSPNPAHAPLPPTGYSQSNGIPHMPAQAVSQAANTQALIPAEVAALVAEKGYNPREFDTKPAYARFFVIKSFTEDDVFKSIRFEIWSSTTLGNNRLDKAHKESAEKGPIYLFFSVNASGHFCGVAQMLTALDYNVTSNVWAQNDKWKGVMKLKWLFIRDIPNPALRHLKLTNTNEQKPVTSSRDTQEVPYEQGCEMLKIFHTYQAKTSLLQDFAFYQQQTEQAQLFNAGAPSLPAVTPLQQASGGSASVTPAFNRR